MSATTRPGRAARASSIAGRLLLAIVLAAGTLLVALAAAPAALAASAWWQIGAEAAPTNLPPEGRGLVVVNASDLGDAPIEGAREAVTITVKLPAGIVASSVETFVVHGVPVQCTVATVVSCRFTGVLYPYERLEVPIRVQVQAPEGTEASLAQEVAIEGGGATRAAASLPLKVSPKPAGFGVASYQLGPVNEDGSPAVQAGSHPFQLTTAFTLNQNPERMPVALPKDLSFTLPPGMIGDPNGASQCSMADFISLVHQTNICPASSVVGVANVVANEPKAAHVFTRTVPVFNLVPSQGEPARLGFEVIGKVPIVIDTSVRTGRGYEVIASVRDATETAGLLSSQVTLWGVPGADSHDASRGWECVAGGEYAGEVDRPCPAQSEVPEQAFLTLPTACAADPTNEPVSYSVEADSWATPGSFLSAEYAWLNGAGEALGFEGCAGLPFTPSITMQADEHLASTPTGLTVSAQLPQGTTLQAGALGEADVRDTTVTLPEGVWLNPSAATGLEACSEAQAGFEGIDPTTGAQDFAGAPAACPEGSKVGVVHIRTPLLSHELEGAVYLASPAPGGEGAKNPFNSLVALYLVAEDPVSGVLVKLAGEGHLDEATGRVSTTFRNTPEVPFEELQVQLFGGPRASVSTAPFCGAHAGEGIFTPWSGTEAVAVSSPANGIEVQAGPGGSSCPGSQLDFTPAFAAHATNTNAGAFTAFTVAIERPDGNQQLSGLAMHLPAGIAAKLASVTPCQEPPAGVEWTCGADSLIGQSSAVSGLGEYPVRLPGNVFLTTGYDGAPFGLLVQTHAKAGPFDLGNVNVRSRIDVDPNTAAVSIVTDPGPRHESFPTMIRGIPAQIKQIVVNVDRPEFEFNPTNCTPATIKGTLSGAEGASRELSSAFAVGNCQNLPFAPILAAATNGHASKADGASFVVKVTSGGIGASGVAEAGIAKVDLQLPVALPARLSTLQKACTEKAFNANPASCPEGSVIGAATIDTPVLKNPLAGPAYLVSHGNAAFPDVEFVLQGEGITLVLDGKTQIKGGVTYSKFESAPDAPFTTFETVLPAGPHSALTANVPAKDRFSLCGQSLRMPTMITGQNGSVIERDTKIDVQGCAAVKAAKARRLTNAQKRAKALAACAKKYRHANARRIRCERQARRRYPLVKHPHKRRRSRKGTAERRSSANSENGRLGS